MAPNRSDRKRDASESTKLVDAVMSQRHTYELLQISPEVTMNALTAIEESDQFDEFLASAKSLNVRASSLRTIQSMGEVNEMLVRVKGMLRLISGSSSNVGYACEHLLRCTKRVQAFVRKALEKRRRNREFTKARCVAAQDRARRMMEIVVKDRVKRLKSTQSQGLLEDTWGVLIDCYVSPDDMVKAINSYYREETVRYLRDFREYRKAAKHACSAKNELHSTRRRKLREAMLKFPALCEVVNLCPQLPEVCIHLEYVQACEVTRNVALERGDSVVIQKLHVPNLRSLVSPVSYYHALITLNPKQEFMLLLALRSVNNGVTDPKAGISRINGPSRQHLQRARTMKMRWCASLGKEMHTSSNSNATEVEAPKINELGSPKACVETGPHVPTGRVSPMAFVLPPRKNPSPGACGLPPTTPTRSPRNNRTSLHRVVSALTATVASRGETPPRNADETTGVLTTSNSSSQYPSGGRPNSRGETLWKEAFQSHRANIMAHRRQKSMGSSRSEMHLPPISD